MSVVTHDDVERAILMRLRVAPDASGDLAMCVSIAERLGAHSAFSVGGGLSRAISEGFVSVDRDASPRRHLLTPLGRLRLLELGA